MQVRSNVQTVAGVLVALVVGVLSSTAAPALAQDSISSSSAVAPSTTQLKRANLSKMMRQIPEVNFQDHRLEDVLSFITEITGADMEPIWIDDKSVDGLDKDSLVSLKAKRVSALKLLEMVLEKVGAESAVYSGGNTWQMTEWGSIECGPKELLARRARLEVYPINDLLWEIPDYEESPTIDLQSVLQSSRGGSGGQSPFTNTQQQNQDRDRRTKDDRAQDIIDIIEALVEPETWLTGGGTASIRYFQSNLLVRAPDFVHRKLGGYPWWPAAQTSAKVVNGRRYVSLGVDTGISMVDDLVNQPVTGVVGGGPGGGGGGPFWQGE